MENILDLLFSRNLSEIKKHCTSRSTVYEGKKLLSHLLSHGECPVEVWEYVLLDLKCRVDVVDQCGLSAFHEAVLRDQMSLVVFMLENIDFNVNHVGTVDPYEGYNAFFLCQNKEMVKVLLKYKLNIHHVNQQGDHLLSHAIQSSKMEISEYVFNLDELDINHANKKGWTPLMIASGNGSSKMVHLLLDEDDIRINQKDKDGFTALHHALQVPVRRFCDGFGKENRDNAYRLVKCGGDMKIKSKSGHLCTDFTCVQFKELLQLVSDRPEVFPEHLEQLFVYVDQFLPRISGNPSESARILSLIEYLRKDAKEKRKEEAQGGCPVNRSGSQSTSGAPSKCPVNFNSSASSNGNNKPSCPLGFGKKDPEVQEQPKCPVPYVENVFYFVTRHPYQAVGIGVGTTIGLGLGLWGLRKWIVRNSSATEKL